MFIRHKFGIINKSKSFGTLFLSFAFIFNQKLGITLLQIINNKLAKNKASCAGIFVSCDDRVETAVMLDTSVTVA